MWVCAFLKNVYCRFWRPCWYTSSPVLIVYANDGISFFSWPNFCFKTRVEKKKRKFKPDGAGGVKLWFFFSFCSPFLLLYTVEFHPRHWFVYLADEPHNLTSGAVPSYLLLFSCRLFRRASLVSHSPLFCRLIIFFFSFLPSLATPCGDVGNYGTKKK